MSHKGNKGNKRNKSKARRKPKVTKGTVQAIDNIIAEHNKPKDKPDTTKITTIQKGQEDIVKVVDNETGKLVPTKEDKAKVEAVKEAQRIYRLKRLEAQEAMRKAKQAFEALNGSEAIKALKADLEDKIEDKLNLVNSLRDDYKVAVDEYNSLLSEYKDLTGISKKALKANSKGKSSPRLTGDGSWQPTVKLTDKDTVKILVKHKPTNDLFEYSLIADGMIPYSSWIDLRHAFTKHYQAVYDALDTGAKANFRAFLYPRLYTLIANVKAIADKV